MFPRIFARYFTLEMFQGLVFGTAIVFAVWFSTDEFQELLGLMTVLGITAYKCFILVMLGIPRITVDNLPIAIFVGGFLVLRRMRDDNEILALKVSGIPLYKIWLFPALMGVVAAGCHFFLMEVIEPIAVKQFRHQLTLAVYKSKTPVGMMRSSVVQQKQSDGSENIFLLAKDPKGNLKEAFVLSFQKHHRVRVITSHSVNVSEGAWTFKNGHIYDFSPRKTGYQTLAFSTMKIPNEAKLEVLFEPTDDQPRYMTLARLWNSVNVAQAKVTDMKNFILCQYHLHRKFAEPLACLLFIIAVIPVTSYHGRKATFYGDSVYAAILVIGYYVIRSSAEVAGHQQIISVALSAWIPDLYIAVVFVAATLLLNKGFSLGILPDRADPSAESYSYASPDRKTRVPKGLLSSSQSAGSKDKSPVATARRDG